MADFFPQPAVVRLLASIVFVVAVLVTRSIVARWVAAGAHILSDNQRRQMFYLRSAVTGGILVGLVLIWASALQSLLLSLTAVLLAVVISASRSSRRHAKSIVRSIAASASTSPGPSPSSRA